MYDKNFQDISSGKMELFSSFFSAIKTFISELVLEGSKELKNIEMGDYAVMISAIPSIKADLVLIADKDDQKLVNKLIPKLIKILLKHQETFQEWNGDRDLFSVLDQPLSELILTKKKLIGDHSMIENPEEVLKSMWAHKGELTPYAKEGLTQERDFLISRLDKTRNIVRQQVIAEKIVEISEQLRDDAGFIGYQNVVKKLKDQVKDTKIKLRYYLDRIKEALSTAVDALGNRRLIDGDYKDAYLHLYSFSSKLKLVTTGTEHEKYRHLANLLINKSEFEDHQLSEAISEVLKMNDDIEEYIEYD
jgi:hypothetical protein